MELKYFSENCLSCKCRTCKATYELIDESEACYTWCKENCKGEDPLDYKPDNECHNPIEKGVEYAIKNKIEMKISELINQLQDEQEPVDGSEWHSGYNNGLARAVELLCEFYNSAEVQGKQ